MHARRGGEHRVVIGHISSLAGGSDEIARNNPVLGLIIFAQTNVKRAAANHFF